MKTLTKEEIDFLEKTVVPCFVGGTDKDLLFVIFDRHGAIILASELFMKYVGAKNLSDIKGKKLLDLGVYKNPKLRKQIEKMQQQVMDQHKIVSFLKFSSNQNEFKIHHINYIPLFNIDRSFTGILAIGNAYRYLAPMEYFDHIIQPKSPSVSKTPLETPVTLTLRQHEILYLLVYGLTQVEIAQILKIQRGTISRVISNICLKLDVAGSSTKILVEKAVKLGLHKKIPASLLLPKVIVLDPSTII